MMVLHPRTARVLVRRVFLTEEPYTWWADLVWWMRRVVPGRVVVLAAGDRASVGLRHARVLFQHLGSVSIPFLGYDTSWSWAFVKGGRTIYETVVRGPLMSHVSAHISYANETDYLTNLNRTAAMGTRKYARASGSQHP
uniref:ILEI/PANDER domain-containing protein n=1 Tax=Scylla olivacea TaxID=85551 RepID=A0A0P4WF24_SCYOL